MSRRHNAANNSDNEVDAQLAARLAKLTGMPDSAPLSSTKRTNAFDFDERPRSESDLIDEILAQAVDVSVLEQKHQDGVDRSLEDRLARLKAPGAVPETKSTAKPTSAAVEPTPVEPRPQRVNPMDELEWLSSDDENDEEVLERVINMALAYSDTEEDR